jgi:hypothetical protein
VILSIESPLILHHVLPSLECLEHLIELPLVLGSIPVGLPLQTFFKHVAEGSAFFKLPFPAPFEIFLEHQSLIKIFHLQLFKSVSVKTEEGLTG